MIATIVMTVINAKLSEMYRSVDMNGVILECGQRYVDKLGYTMDEIIGTPFFDHTPAESREDLRTSFAAWKESNNTNIAKRIQL